MPRTKEDQQKIVRLVYSDAAYAGHGVHLGGDEWLEEIGPTGTDHGMLTIAHGAVYAHTAAWIAYLMTGELVGLWTPPVTVEATGLPYDRKAHSYSRLWQIKGTALLEVARLGKVVTDLAEVQVTDYRAMGAGRVRRSSETATRAAAWCAEYDRRQRETGGTRPVMPSPTVKPPVSRQATTTEGHDDRLDFYRRALVTANDGDIEG